MIGHVLGATLTSVRIRAALALGVVLTASVTGTFAYWTDSATINGNTFATGTIDLKVDGQDTVTGDTTLSLSTMVPGNSMAAVYTIKNNGDTALTYTASTTATDADGKGLRSALVTDVTGATSATGSAPAITCGGASLAGAQSSLDGALLSTPRTLAAGDSEKVCLEVSLPDGASSSLQGATTDVVISFTGTSDLS